MFINISTKKFITIKATPIMRITPMIAFVSFRKMAFIPYFAIPGHENTISTRKQLPSKEANVKPSMVRVGMKEGLRRNLVSITNRCMPIA
jgi:hypothetical protein